MTRGCTLPGCQRSPAKKAICCGMRLCQECASSVKAHDCPRAKELAAIAADPKRLRQWRQEQEREEELTTEVVVALNKLNDVGEAFQAKKRGGTRPGQIAMRVADVIGWTKPDGIFFGVETKKNHKDDCLCEVCEGQRDWGRRLTGAGGIYVSGVRKVQQAVDGVRMGIARRRGSSLEVAAS